MNKRTQKITLIMAAMLIMGTVPVNTSSFVSSAAMTGWKGLPAVSVYQEAETLEQEAADEDIDYDGFIFKLKDGSTDRLKGDMPDGVEKVDYSNDTFTAEEIDSISDLVPDRAIEYIEPNYTVHLFDTGPFSQADPDDPYYTADKQWNLDLMNVPAVWNYGLEGQDLDDRVDMNFDGNAGNDPVVIAVIDSGLKEGHEDIDFNRVVEGRSFVSGSASTDDELGHGTFVSGMIMAVKDNGVGIAGIAQDVQVMPIRVFQSSSASTATIVSAIRFAAEERTAYNESKGEEGTNISVINMSLGSAGASTAMETAIQDAMAAGIIVVCAAGNDGNTTASYPAQYAIGVGSTDQTNTVSEYSQRLSAANGSGYQNKVWVTAPGEKVSGPYYTSTSAYLTGSGTSFSSPEVAALAAICKGLDNDMTHSEFQQLLKETAVPKAGSAGSVNGQDVEYGWGCVDFENTVRGLIGDMTGTSAVTLEMRNGAGSAVAGAVLQVYETASAEDGSETFGAEILPDATGTYLLKKGQRYLYKASAPLYGEQTGTIVSVTDTRHISITLTGQTYPTRFIVRNTANEIISGAQISLTTSGGRPVEASSNGSFPTGNGSYKYTVRAGGYFPVSGSFVIDDMQETLSAADGYTVQVLMHGDIDVCSVGFDAFDADNEKITDTTVVRVFDEAGDEIDVYEDGYFKLPPGTYSYTAENTAYRKAKGSFLVTEDSKGLVRMKRVYLTEKLCTVYVITRPVSLRPAITVVNGAGETETPTDANGSYRLSAGTYRYTIVLEGYVTYTGSFTVEDKIKTVEIILYPDSEGGTVQDDGTANDRYLTVGETFYSVSSLSAHAGTFGSGNKEGILLTDIAKYFVRNPQALTSVTVASGDGRRNYSLSAEEAGSYAILWEGEGAGASFLLFNMEEDTVVDADVSKVNILYHDHSEVEKILAEPNCTEPGLRRFTCTECGEIRDDEMPALGHDFDQNGICRRCGSEQVISEDDTFITIGERKVSLTEMKRHTAKANYTYIESMDGSSYSIPVEGITLRDLFEYFTDSKVCVTGVSVTGTDGYSGTYASADFDRTMVAWLIDGAVPGSYDTDNGLRIAVDGGRSGEWLFSPSLMEMTAGEHSYGTPKTAKATCGSEGYSLKTCTLCGHEEKYDIIPATGLHQWDGGHDITDDQGCATGTRIYYCTVCGTSKTEEIPAGEIVPGDINGDGTVTAADLKRLQSAILKRITLDERARAAADLNGDGKLTAADLLRLKKMTAGKAS